MIDCTERRAGIYTIRNEVTGGRYYGSSVNLARRSSQHRQMLRANRHPNPKMQNSWNKYGEAAFRFAVLAVLEREDLKRAEGLLLDRHHGDPLCLNLAKDPISGMRGLRHTEESKEKNRIAHLGRLASNATRALLSAMRVGSTQSVEARQKRSVAQKGKTLAPEHRAKIGPATKAAMARPEVRAKVAVAHVGRVHTPIARANMAAAQMGHAVSDERRAKQSASMKATWARKRAERAA